MFAGYSAIRITVVYRLHLIAKLGWRRRGVLPRLHCEN